MGNKKFLFVVAASLLLINPILAQNDGGFPDQPDFGVNSGDLVNSLVSGIYNLTGVQEGNTQKLLIFVSGFGLLWLSMNVILEAGLGRIGMLSYFTSEDTHSRYDDSRLGISGIVTRLRIVSFLLTTLILATGIWTELLYGPLYLLYLGLGFGVFAFALYASGSFGIASLSAGRTIGAGVTKYGAEANEEIRDATKKWKEAGGLLNRAKEEEEDAEQRAEEGNTESADEEARDAEQEIKRALDDIEAAESEINDVLNTRYSEVRATLNKAKQAVQIQNNETGELRDFKTRIGELRQDLVDLKDAAHPSNANSWNDIYNHYTGTKPEVHEQIKQLQKDLERMNEEESKEETAFRDQLDELLDIMNSFKSVAELLDKLPETIKKAETEEELLEKISSRVGDKSLRDAVGRDENEIRDIGQKMENLRSELEKLEGAIEEVEEFVEEQFSIEERELQQIEQLANSTIEDCINQVGATLAGASNNGFWNPNENGSQEEQQMGDFRDAMNQMESKLRTIQGELQELKQRNEEERSILKNTTEKIKNFLN